MFCFVLFCFVLFCSVLFCFVLFCLNFEFRILGRGGKRRSTRSLGRCLARFRIVRGGFESIELVAGRAGAKWRYVHHHQPPLHLSRPLALLFARAATREGVGLGVVDFGQVSRTPSLPPPLPCLFTAPSPPPLSRPQRSGARPCFRKPTRQTPVNATLAIQSHNTKIKSITPTSKPQIQTQIKKFKPPMDSTHSNSNSNSNSNRYMFSATMPPAVERLARKYLRR